MTLSPDIAQILLDLFDELEWEDGDMLNIQIGGSSVSGIEVGEDYNPKWSRPKGVVKHNKDAVIIIKNVNISPTTTKTPNVPGIRILFVKLV